METALWIAVSVLSVVCLALIAALVLMLWKWPTEKGNFGAWISAYQQGLADGDAYGKQAGAATEKMKLSAWNTARAPVEQESEPVDRPVERSVQVGDYPRVPGMPLPTPPRGGGQLE